MQYHIKNWDDYQHYKDRNPPWIKLHYELLSSADWVMLDNASRVLAVACMLLASRNDGYIPHKPEYIQRVAYLHAPPDFAPLVECGFLMPDDECKQMLASASTLLADASTLLADASGLQADARPETETETETETYSCVHFAAFWDAYPVKRDKKKAQKTWKARKLDAKADIIIADVHNRIANDEQWKAGYIPMPTTYINGDRWEDDLSGRCATTQTLPQHYAGSSKAAEALANNQREFDQ